MAEWLKASDSKVVGPGFEPRPSACGGIGVHGSRKQTRSCQFLPKKLNWPPFSAMVLQCEPAPDLNIVKVCEPM